MIRSRLADQVGRVVGGRYRLLAPVGTGASADVYVADDVKLRRRVAVKLLHEALAGDEGFLRRFRAEARTAAGLRHPNIMAVFDWGEEGPGPYLVLEYLGGGSVRDLLDRNLRLTASQATLVGLEAARGLGYAHRRGLVHRDIKPANLLFDDEGRLAIADFGIARALAEATWTEPAGAMIGTARYASPEQARGGSLDGRADLYALGLVLVEAVTGVVPFAADTTIATLMARVDRPIPVPPELGPLGAVIESVGAVDPNDRVDAAGMIRGLESAAASLPSPEPLPITPAAQLPLSEPRHDDATTGYAPRQSDATTSYAPPTRADATTSLPNRHDATTPYASGRGEDVTRVYTPRPPTQAPPPPSGADVQPERKRPGRWRYPWVAIAIIVIAAVVALGVLARSAFAQSSYVVPTLTGQPVPTVDPPHFHVVRHDVRVGPPTGVVVGQHPAANTRHHAGTITVDVSIGYALVPVPNLQNMTEDQARAALTAVNLKATFGQGFSDSVPAGRVASWSGAGTQVESHTTTITVTISGGPEFVTVPDVTNQPAAQATANLQAAGFGNVNPTQAFSDTVPAGTVITTDPAPNTQGDRGGTVTLTVSKGPDVVAVPDVRGQTIAAAEAKLTAAGLSPSGPYGPPGAGIAVQTDPPPGRKVKRGSAVAIYAGYF